MEILEHLGKGQIVQLTMEADASVAEIARDHLFEREPAFKWRRAGKRGELSDDSPAVNRKQLWLRSRGEYDTTLERRRHARYRQGRRLVLVIREYPTWPLKSLLFATVIEGPHTISGRR
jgi:transposase-like protein